MPVTFRDLIAVNKRNSVLLVICFILFVGAEFCPYCAAQRWPLIIALSRFGTFSGLQTTTSSSSIEYPNTITFTFRSATFTSQYIDALAPSNFALTNPEVFRETISTGGQNLVKGVVLLAAVITDSFLNPRNEETAQQGDI